MSFQSELYYALLLLASTITSVPVSYYALTQRGKFAGSTTFAITLLAMAFWQVTAALEILAVEPASKLLWGNLQFFAVVSIPVGWLAMTYQYITDGAWVTLRRVAMFSAVPIVTLIL